MQSHPHPPAAQAFPTCLLKPLLQACPAAPTLPATMYLQDFAVYKPPESRRINMDQHMAALANPEHPLSKAGCKLTSERSRRFMRCEGSAPCTWCGWPGLLTTHSTLAPNPSQ